MEEAKNHVEGHPCRREPPRPVGAAKHKGPTNNRRKFHNENPDEIVFKRLRGLVVTEVARKPDDSRRYEQATED